MRSKLPLIFHSIWCATSLSSWCRHRWRPACNDGNLQSSHKLYQPPGITAVWLASACRSVQIQSQHNIILHVYFINTISAHRLTACHARSVLTIISSQRLHVYDNIAMCAWLPSHDPVNWHIIMRCPRVNCRAIMQRHNPYYYYLIVNRTTSLLT